MWYGKAGLGVGSGMSQRIGLPSVRWDKPAGDLVVPKKMVCVGTMTVSRRWNIKTNTLSTQT